MHIEDVLDEVADRLDREDALGKELVASTKALLRLNRLTSDEARDAEGWTPDLVTAARRYANGLIEKGEYMAEAGRHFEGLLAKSESQP